MKKFLLLFGILFLFFLNVKSQPEWTWQNPLPQGNHLNSIFFTDSLNGYACGYLGSIIRTSNGGQTWQFVKTKTNNELFTTWFIDSLTGFFAGANGLMLKTSNGGQTFDTVFYAPGKTIRSMVFIDNQNGAAIGDNGLLIKSLNGGQTWTYDTIPGASTVSFNKIYYSMNNFYAVGTNGVIVKQPIGSSWYMVTSGTSNTLNSISFYENIGYAVGNTGTVLKSIDYGDSWSTLTAQTTLDLKTVWATDFNNAYIAGLNGTLKMSIDAGSTWFQIANSNTVMTLLGMHFNSPTNGYVCGGNGIILKTQDGNGFNIQQSFSIVNDVLQSVCFYDTLKGFAVGKNGRILRTINAGQQWMPISSGTISNLNSVYYINPSKVMIVGDVGINKISNDGGSTWSNGPITSTTGNLKKIFFINDQKGFIVGGTGLILRTNDGGATWTQVTSNSTKDLESIYFQSNLIGYAVGQAGTILKTIDGGTTWSSLSSGSSAWLYDINFINDFIGIAVGTGGTILKTYNGGQTWISVNPGSSNILYAIKFVSYKHAFVVGESGVYFRTNNAGDTWTADKSNTSQDLKSIYFTKPTEGYVVGGNGNILKLKTPPPPVCNATINGTINFATGGFNPGSVEIKLFTESPYTISGMKLIASTVNSANGFSFNNLIEGKYYMRANVIDTIGYPQIATTYYNNAYMWQNADTLNVMCDSVYNIVFIMKTKPTITTGNIKISGKIRYNNNSPNKSVLGEPVPGADITLEQEPDDEPVANTLTDSLGVFGFINLPPAIYTVKVDIPGLPQFQIDTLNANNDTIFNEINYLVDTNTTNPGIYLDQNTFSNYISFDNIDFIISPNPAKDFINIQYFGQEKLSNIKIDIISYEGKLLNTKLFKTLNENNRISIENINSSYIFVKMNVKGHHIIKKVLIIK